MVVRALIHDAEPDLSDDVDKVWLQTDSRPPI